jgi:hypothetical protein
VRHSQADHPTFAATPSPSICSRPAATSAPSSSCSRTGAWRRRPTTRASRPAGCAPPRALSICSRSRWPHRRRLRSHSTSESRADAAPHTGNGGGLPPLRRGLPGDQPTPPRARNRACSGRPRHAVRPTYLRTSKTVSLPPPATPQLLRQSSSSQTPRPPRQHPPVAHPNQPSVAFKNAPIITCQHTIRIHTRSPQLPCKNIPYFRYRLFYSPFLTKI